MTPETNANYQKIIYESFESMKGLLDVIRDRIAAYPVYTQLEFIKPFQHMIGEAYIDATNPDDSFLNNYDGAENIEVEGSNQADPK